MDIQPLDAETTAWKDSLLRTAQEAGFHFEPPELYADFEQLIGQYQQATIADADVDVTEIQQMVGLVVGEYLRTELGMEWVIISDDYGTDLAILATAPDGSHVYSCPIIVVGKRFSTDYEPGQLEAFCNQFLGTSKAQLFAR